MAVSTPRTATPPVLSPRCVVGFGSDPERLRVVSQDSLVLPGHTVEILPDAIRSHDCLRVRTTWGAAYDLPCAFLLRVGETVEPRPRRALLAKPKPLSSKPKPLVIAVPPEAPAQAKVQQEAIGVQQEAPKVQQEATEPQAAVLPATAPPVPQTPADLSPQARARWRASLPRLTDEQGDKTAAPVVGGELVTIDGIECVVAKDGTFRPVTTSAYRGLRAMSATYATGREWGTRHQLAINSGMVSVTLVQPPRRDRDSIRAAVLRAIVATSTEGEFLSESHRLRANRAERQLAQRVRALRGVGIRSREDWDIRRSVGVQIHEIRMR